MSYNYGTDYSSASAGTGVGVATLIFYIVIVALLLVSMWKIFVKCGKPGWACIVPIYNIITMLDIAGKPTWYILLFLIPFANIYVAWVCYDGMAKKLGKSSGFTIGMLLLPVIFFPILAFSNTNVVETPIAEPMNSAPETPIDNTIDNNQNASEVSEPVTPASDFTSTPVAPEVNTAPSVDTSVDELSQGVNEFNNAVTEPTTNVVSEQQTPSVDTNSDVISDLNNDANNNGQL